MKLNRTVFTSAMLAAAVGACSDDDKPVTGNARPITKEEVTTFSVANSRALLTEVWDLRKWLDQTEMSGEIEEVIPFGDEEEPGEPSEPVDYDGELAEVLEDVEGFLKTQLLEVSTVEAETRTAVTYKLDAQRLCDYDPDAEPVLDEWGDPVTDGKDCFDFVNASELRVKVTSFAEGDLDATVLAGADRDAVVRFELHEDLASIEVDLAPVAALMQHYLDVTEGDEGTTVQASGKGRVVVRRLADDQMRISADVLTAIDVSIESDEADENVAFTFAPGSFAIDIDAPADSATLDIDLGAFTLSGPKTILPLVDDGCYLVTEEIGGEEVTYEECDPDAPSLEGSGAVTFGGLSAYIDFDDSEKALAVRGLVLGKLGVVADDKTIIEIGGDASAPATDFTFSFDAADNLVLELSRAFELSGMFRTAQAPDIFDLGDWAADEDLGIALAGEKPTLRMEDHGVVVQAGSLTFTSKHARDTSLEVAAGMCLYISDDEQSEHPFDLSTAAQCPVPTEDF